MNYTKSLTALLLLALGTAAVDAGPPRRQRWSPMYTPMGYPQGYVLHGGYYYPVQEQVYYPPIQSGASYYVSDPSIPTHTAHSQSPNTPIIISETPVVTSSSTPVAETKVDPATTTKVDSISSTKVESTTSTKVEPVPGEDALAEVNATRAQRGLPPFQPDPLLNQAALACAKQRAARLIDGHLPESDFTYVPTGGQASSAGCAAWEPSWGWGSCCTYDHYTYGGAAWVMGSDGKRYMHLFVR